MKKLILALLLGTIIVLGVVNLANPASTTIVISEFKVKGTAADDEFIEIYNMTSSTFNLNGYRLVYRTASGTSDNSIKSWTSDTYIPAYGHYLWANSGGIYAGIADATTTTSLSGTGGGIAIRLGAMDTGTIIDSVGYGNATNAFVETTAKSPVHADNKSFERQRSGVSITDTDNNNSDFTEIVPTPMNSSDPSLPVTLSSLTAIRADSGVMIQWTTETETDHVGWDVYRSESKDGKFVKINEELIKGSGNSGMPHTYQYVDKTAIAGRQYYYYLEDFDIFGNTGKSDIIGISKGKAPSAKDSLSTTWGEIKQKQR
jgi:hypothetical protein